MPSRLTRPRKPISTATSRYSLFTWVSFRSLIRTTLAPSISTIWRSKRSRFKNSSSPFNWIGSISSRTIFSDTICLFSIATSESARITVSQRRLTSTPQTFGNPGPGMIRTSVTFPTRFPTLSITNLPINSLTKTSVKGCMFSPPLSRYYS